MFDWVLITPLRIYTHNNHITSLGGDSFSNSSSSPSTVIFESAGNYINNEANADTPETESYLSSEREMQTTK